MFFSEVDVAQKAPTPNYNYIRSSEDISSGYSSAEPISTGLSRTASMTNATRPRFKAKRAEEDIYLESDEYEAMPEVRHPNYYSPYAYYPINPVLSSKPQRYNPSEIDDLKSQAYLDNEKYFQDSVLETLRNTESKKSTDDSNVLANDRQNSVNVEERNMYDSNVTDKSNREEPLKVAEEMADKYELFCKWLENNEMLNSKCNSNTEIPVVSSSILYQADDEFRDTMSTSSADELFHDAQHVDSQLQKSPPPPPSLLDIILSEKLDVLSSVNPDSDCRKKSESVDSMEGESSLPSILDEFNSARKNSSSDPKRPAVHNKGKAPEPPTTNALSLEQEDNSLLAAENLPETILSLNTSNEIEDRNSRSPSPRLDSKKSAKKNLFKNYLPSLFRSESPKPNPEDQLKETQI